MPVDPYREDQERRAREKNVVSPGSGKNRNDYVQRNRGRVTAPPGMRKPTKHGYEIVLFEGEDFTTRYEVFFPGNNTGLGVNNDGDKSILVIHGMLYASLITVDSETKQDVTGEQIQVPEGSYLQIPAGVKFWLATSAQLGAELYVVESPEYSKYLKLLDEPTYGRSLSIPEDVSIPARHIERRPQDPKTVQQALEMAAHNNKRVNAAQENANKTKRSTANVNVIGVNPRPIIPTEE